jgi:hypothetical protein
VQSGTRDEVVGGQHLNALTDLLCDVIRAAGFSPHEVKFRTGVELPGFYRPTKKWDVVVVRNSRLCAAIELKSQVGSFGNNTNNRAEEALGNAVDLWRAFKDSRLGLHPPWLGYFVLLETAHKSTRPIRVPRALFDTDPAFTGASYAERYRILCQRMVLERHYNAAMFLMTPRGSDGSYSEPSPDLATSPFLKGLFGHLIGCV